MTFDFFKNINQLIKIKKVRSLLGAFVLSNIGDRAFSAALPLYVFIQKADVSNFSKILFFEAIPMLVLSTIVAEIIARYNKKRLMLICDFARFILVGSILICQHNTYYYCVAFLMTTFSMINAGSRNVLYYNITPKKHYPILASVNSTVRNLTKISIMPLTAFLLIYLEPYIFFLINMVSYVASFAFILPIDKEQGEVLEKPKKMKGILKEYNKVFYIIRNDPILYTFMWCSIFTGIMFGITNFFFPIYLVNVLQDTIRNLPNYLVFEAIGSIFSGFLIINYIKKLNLIHTTSVTLGIFTLLFILIYIFQLKLVVLIVFLFVGIALNVLNVSIVTLLQSRISNEDRVRIGNFSNIIGQLSFLIPGMFLFISSAVPADIVFLFAAAIAAFAGVFIFSSTWLIRDKGLIYGD